MVAPSNYFKELRIKKESEDDRWQINIHQNGQYGVPMPARMTKGSVRPKTKDRITTVSAPTKLKIKIISNIINNCENPHTYLRLDTFSLSNDFYSLTEKCQVEIQPKKKKNESLVLIDDCQAQHAWGAILDSHTAMQEGKILFTLKNKSSNWKAMIEAYYKIVVDTFYLRRPISDFQKELDQCYLLCYSILDDSALIIAKTEISENEFLSILDNIANEEHLQLVINKNPF